MILSTAVNCNHTHCMLQSVISLTTSHEYAVFTASMSELSRRAINWVSLPLTPGPSSAVLATHSRPRAEAVVPILHLLRR